MQVEFNARCQIRPVILVALLVAGDIGTTVLDQYLLGARFLEKGSVNGVMIKHFGAYWYLPAYGIELLEFAGSALLMLRIWRHWKFKKLGLWARVELWASRHIWEITYLLVLGLIANNLIAGFIIGPVSR